MTLCHVCVPKKDQCADCFTVLALLFAICETCWQVKSPVCVVAVQYGTHMLKNVVQRLTRTVIHLIKSCSCYFVAEIWLESNTMWLWNIRFDFFFLFKKLHSKLGSIRSASSKVNVEKLEKTKRSLLKETTFSFPLSSSMHLFDDYDDTSSSEFRQFYPLRNHRSLIFIFAIIDSKGLTNNCLDFFSPSVLLHRKKKKSTLRWTEGDECS